MDVVQGDGLCIGDLLRTYLLVYHLHTGRFIRQEGKVEFGKLAGPIQGHIANGHFSLGLLGCLVSGLHRIRLQLHQSRVILHCD